MKELLSLLQKSPCLSFRGSEATEESQKGGENMRSFTPLRMTKRLFARASIGNRYRLTGYEKFMSFGAEGT